MRIINSLKQIGIVAIFTTGMFVTNMASGDNILVKWSCSTPGENDIVIILVEVECPSPKACWPDPDDISIWDADLKRNTGWAVSRSVKIDSKGKILDWKDRSENFRAVWDIGMSKKLVPETVQLYYGADPITRAFKVGGSCREFPVNILQHFNLK